MSTEAWLMIVAIFVEGPLLMWWGMRQKKGEDMTNELKSIRRSIAKVHERVDSELDEIESKYASKDEVSKEIEHAKELNAVQFDAILKNLDYIRKRLDESRE